MIEISFFKELIIILWPEIKKELMRFMKIKEQDQIDGKNIIAVKEDIENGKDRETREKDLTNLLNGKS